MRPTIHMNRVLCKINLIFPFHSVCKCCNFHLLFVVAVVLSAVVVCTFLISMVRWIFNLVDCLEWISLLLLFWPQIYVTMLVLVRGKARSYNPKTNNNNTVERRYESLVFFNSWPFWIIGRCRKSFSLHHKHRVSSGMRILKHGRGNSWRELKKNTHSEKNSSAATNIHGKCCNSIKSTLCRTLLPFNIIECFVFVLSASAFLSFPSHQYLCTVDY